MRHSSRSARPGSLPDVVSNWVRQPQELVTIPAPRSSRCVSPTSQGCGYKRPSRTPLMGAGSRPYESILPKPGPRDSSVNYRTRHRHRGAVYGFEQRPRKPVNTGSTAHIHRVRTSGSRTPPPNRVQYFAGRYAAKESKSRKGARDRFHGRGDMARWSRSSASSSGAPYARLTEGALAVARVPWG